MKNKRISFIDITRALAILLIVFGHTIVHNGNTYRLFNLIYSFHVVLFFIISGYLYNREKNTKEFVVKKFLTLMIPYFIFTLAFLLPYFLFGRSVNATINANATFKLKDSILEILYGVGYQLSLRQNNSLWFLPALFTTEVLYKLLDTKILQKINIWIKLSFLFIISFFSTKLSLILPWGINTALVVMPFYSLGFILKEYKLIEKLSTNTISKIILFLLVIEAIYISKINGTISCSDYIYGNYLYFLFTSIIFSLTTFLISFKIGKNKVLQIIGQNTLSILIFHKIIIILFQTKINFSKIILSTGSTLNCILLGLFITMISVSVSLLLGFIIKKYFPYLYGMKKPKLKDQLIGKGGSKMLKYIIRLDDACPNMNEENWNKMEKLLDKYNIKPIVGIIPANKDLEFNYGIIDKFWQKYPQKWQKKGWIMALHGYHHKYDFPHSHLKKKKTEYMGKSYTAQKKILAKGYKILKEKNIKATCFFAPNHSFDKLTIKACTDLKYFSFISDGYAFFPYKYKGMLFLPSVFDTPHKISKNGIFTFVYHPNHITDNQLEYLENFIKANLAEFDVDIDEIVKTYANRKRNLKDFILYFCITIYRKMRFIIRGK